MNPLIRLRGLLKDGRAGLSLAAVAAAAVVVVAAVAAACGSGSQGTATQPGENGQTAPTALQVLTKVERGDLTESVAAPVTVKSLGATTIVVATVPAQNAAAVSKGQGASVVLFGGSQSFPRAGQSGMPQPGQSGMPQPGQSGMPQGAPPSGMPQPGASGAPGDGQGGLPGGGMGGDLTGRGTRGVVIAVVANADGTATATIRLDEEPADATAESSGFAAIETKVVASDVIVIPTAAIKGSGSSATVDVMANGKTETRTVEVGQQSGSQSEIVSGLSEGENIVWYRSFPGAGNGQVQQGQSQSSQAGGGTQ
jgi:membrane fusion protein, macrolide-specific efflux system